MSYLNFELIQGDSLEELKKLKDNLFQTCVTSPPYWALRNYFEDRQIGQEQTLEDYIENIVNVCFEVKRVLRDDGTFWLNLGSTYCGTGHKKDTKDKLGGMPKARNGQSFALNYKVEGFKPKDLIPIPWIIAQALQKPILKCDNCDYEGHYIKWGILPDYQKWCPHCKSVVSYKVIEQGWYLRIDNIWRKNNPVPAPVQDRPTMGHEYLFLFSKSKKYFYDHYAIMEEAQSSNKKSRRIGAKNQKGTNRKDQGRFFAGGEKRNKRSVWDASVSRYKGSHFSTFPESLINPCILAGSSTYGCCIKCNSPWKRTLKREEVLIEGSDKYITNFKSKGWEPTCSCNTTEVKPCLVLDPFNGAATTGLVSLKNESNYVGIDINQSYLDLSKDRLIDLDPIFIKEDKLV